MKRVIFATTMAVIISTAGAIGQCVAPQCTKIIDNGPDGSKRILVVLGDGYASGDQSQYNGDVDRLITNGVFGNDFFRENQNAFNVYRINLTSSESGVSERTYAPDGTISSETVRNTALGYIFNGDWGHCWLEGSANTGTLEQNALGAYVPNAEFVAVILNIDKYGGCAWGKHQTVPRGVTWQVMAHEFGHGVGGLWDEYTAHDATYSGSVNGPNCTTDLNRSTIAWKRFVDPATALPTAFVSGMDSNRTVGAFEGCAYVTKGIYRPAQSCRMVSNTPQFCPVCYNYMKTALWPYLGQDFSDAVSGDFTGDGHSDLLLIHPDDLALYRSVSANNLELLWAANDAISGAAGAAEWRPRAHDRYIVADFDGDHKDDLIVFNPSDWSAPRLGVLRSTGNGFELTVSYSGVLPGNWTLRASDQLFAGDFDGDGKADLYVFSGPFLKIPRLALMKSTGTSLANTALYVGILPGWVMSRADRFYVADFTGDHKDDLYVFSPAQRRVSWPPFRPLFSYTYLGMVESTGTGLSTTKRFRALLPSWVMKSHDSLLPADFDGDGKVDLYVLNGVDWSQPYLAMLKSVGTDLQFVKLYSSSAGPSVSIVPGWNLKTHDQFSVADVNKDGRADLVAFNDVDINPNRFGTLLSSGAGLAGSSVSGTLGKYAFADGDRILAANYEGAPGTPDTFVRGNEWLGMIRRTSSGFSLDRVFHNWIYGALYDTETMP